MLVSLIKAAVFILVITLLMWSRTALIAHSTCLTRCMRCAVLRIEIIFILGLLVEISLCSALDELLRCIIVIECWPVFIGENSWTLDACIQPIILSLLIRFDVAIDLVWRICIIGLANSYLSLFIERRCMCGITESLIYWIRPGVFKRLILLDLILIFLFYTFHSMLRLSFQSMDPWRAFEFSSFIFR